MKIANCFLCCMLVVFAACAQKKPATSPAQPPKDLTIKKDSASWNKLTPEETDVIVNKATEYPGTGTLLANTAKGTYICKRCNAPLYRSDSKFDGHCGWPAFDDEIPGAVKKIADPDGERTEIECSNCGAHLGHIFLGEGFTKKNTRHCVNSTSMVFVADKK
jgi:peptide-methionine (R)-S-oxide reductase